MNQYLSQKIRILSSIAIIMVIYIHAFYTEGADMAVLSKIQNIIGGHFCLVAVPLFYVISGYLFFLFVPDGVKSIFGKMKKRCKTLLVPYVLANSLTFLFWIILGLIALRLPMIDSVINTKILPVIQNQSFAETFKLVFITPPIAFQLWFIRDLMVVVFFSPILWLLLRYFSTSKFTSYLFICLLAFVYILWGNNEYLNAFLWFLAGGILSMGRFQIYNPSRNKCLYFIFIILYVGVCVLAGFGYIPSWSKILIPIVGIIALWLIYDQMNKLNNYLSRTIFIQYTFFVYLIHEPLLNIFKKLPLLINKGEITLICCYIFIPVIFYVFACLLGSLLKRIIPKIYSIYTGGR